MISHYFFLFFGRLNVPLAIAMPFLNDLALLCGLVVPPLLAYAAPAL
jgi:hypothetical protein